MHELFEAIRPSLFARSRVVPRLATSAKLTALSLTRHQHIKDI